MALSSGANMEVERLLMMASPPSASTSSPPSKCDLPFTSRPRAAFGGSGISGSGVASTVAVCKAPVTPAATINGIAAGKN